MPKNLTISISDELAKEMDTMPEINWSEVCRQAISNYIDEKKAKEKGEMILGLEMYLQAKSVATEDIRIDLGRKSEIERFTRKWGAPEAQPNSFRRVPPYVDLKKKKDIRIGETTITLRISNTIYRHPDLRLERMSEFDPKKWKDIADGKLGYLVEYFKSKGFMVGEWLFYNQYLIAEFVTDGDMKKAEEICGLRREMPDTKTIEIGKCLLVPGLFAIDKEDIVFMAYRKAKYSNAYVDQKRGWVIEEIE